MNDVHRPKRSQLKCFNPDEPNERLRFHYGGGSFYEEGTFVTRTLDVLSNESSLLCHDERMFQLLHLQTEIAWYNIHFELRAVIRQLKSGQFAEALGLLTRTVQISQLPLVALETMVSCMSQYSLLAFRAMLPDNATGIDSPGMINLRYVTPVLWAEYEQALERMSYTPASLALARARLIPLSNELTLQANIFDAIQQLDIKLMNWKQLHLRMVWMHLGGAVASMQTGIAEEGGSNAEEALELGTGTVPTSLRGRPISILQKMTTTPLFPKLWKIPDLVYQEMNALREAVQ